MITSKITFVPYTNIFRNSERIIVGALALDLGS